MVFFFVFKLLFTFCSLTLFEKKKKKRKFSCYMNTIFVFSNDKERLTHITIRFSCNKVLEKLMMLGKTR